MKVCVITRLFKLLRASLRKTNCVGVREAFITARVNKQKGSSVNETLKSESILIGFLENSCNLLVLRGLLRVARWWSETNFIFIEWWLHVPTANIGEARCNQSLVESQLETIIRIGFRRVGKGRIVRWTDVHIEDGSLRQWWFNHFAKVAWGLGSLYRAGKL